MGHPRKFGKCRFCGKNGVHHPNVFVKGFKGKPGKRARCRYCFKWQDTGKGG